ncbi:hypothetical protein D5R40_13035 [Okeania hirsuta]|uniref:Uncharacterized protein n=1 Tax=Okeania hirsuta TaxID=1458930 RepID=A0A3N6PLW3_9CYAN|nr:hypothetical protein D4Z78_23200 [Okeania hirsuta]RQH43390.1 hypothetical protein D5R40_13035 [Okeania hirsuta]
MLGFNSSTQPTRLILKNFAHNIVAWVKHQGNPIKTYKLNNVEFYFSSQPNQPTLPSLQN